MKLSEWITEYMIAGGLAPHDAADAVHRLMVGQEGKGYLAGFKEGRNTGPPPKTYRELLDESDPD